MAPMLILLQFLIFIFSAPAQSGDILSFNSESACRVMLRKYPHAEVELAQHERQYLLSTLMLMEQFATKSGLPAFQSLLGHYVSALRGFITRSEPSAIESQGTYIAKMISALDLVRARPISENEYYLSISALYGSADSIVPTLKKWQPFSFIGSVKSKLNLIQSQKGPLGLAQAIDAIYDYNTALALANLPEAKKPVFSPWTGEPQLHIDKKRQYLTVLSRNFPYIVPVFLSDELNMNESLFAYAMPIHIFSLESFVNDDHISRFYELNDTLAVLIAELEESGLNNIFKSPNAIEKFSSASVARLIGLVRTSFDGIQYAVEIQKKLKQLNATDKKKEQALLVLVHFLYGTFDYNLSEVPRPVFSAIGLRSVLNAHQSELLHGTKIQPGLLRALKDDPKLASLGPDLKGLSEPELKKLFVEVANLIR